MYENNNSVSIDWKGLFLKVIIVAIIVFAIFKGYEYFSNKQDKSETTTNTSTQLFNANLESLRQAGENYYNNSSFPSEGQTIMTTLAELTTKGDIKELYDEDGNECSGENSYVALTNEKGKYKLKATLTCGGTSNYTVVMIGCECEKDICTITEEDEVENTAKSTKSVNNSSSKSSVSKDNSSNKTSSKNSADSNSTTKAKSSTSGKQVNVYNNYNNSNSNNNVNSNNSNSFNNNSNSNNASGNNNSSKTTKTTKTTKKADTTEEYKVTFDSNGGTSVSSQYVKKYDTAYEPSNPTKNNARFVGWYYNGRLFDFNTPITKNIKLEAYYWETKTLSKQVYTSAWDTYGTSYVSVTHKLAIPSEIRNNSNVKNIRIKSVGSARTMSSSNDLINFVNLHATTFDGYNENGVWNNRSTNVNILATMSNIRVYKENSYEYDRWVVWSAYAANQCRSTFTINGESNKCNYGIVYKVVWEYEILTD